MIYCLFFSYLKYLCTFPSKPVTRQKLWPTQIDELFKLNCGRYFKFQDLNVI